jgi:enoyl-CoA hydratase/carnithine racemase
VISVETNGQVAVVTMTYGRANALDTSLCRALAGHFGQLERDGHRAAVLTGHGNIFSAGVDLLRLRDGPWLTGSRAGASAACTRSRLMRSISAGMVSTAPAGAQRMEWGGGCMAHSSCRRRGVEWSRLVGPRGS